MRLGNVETTNPAPARYRFQYLDDIPPLNTARFRVPVTGITEESNVKVKGDIDVVG